MSVHRKDVFHNITNRNTVYPLIVLFLEEKEVDKFSKQVSFSVWFPDHNLHVVKISVESCVGYFIIFIVLLSFILLMFRQYIYWQCETIHHISSD